MSRRWSADRQTEDPEAALASPAVRLFPDRAAAVRPDCPLADDELATVVEIVRRLDGLPLAIELAAARLRGLPLAEVAARLDDRFRLLTGGPGRRCLGTGRCGRWSSGAGTC